MKNPNEEIIIREIKIPKWVDDYFIELAHKWRRSPERMMADELEDRAQISASAPGVKYRSYYL